MHPRLLTPTERISYTPPNPLSILVHFLLRIRSTINVTRCGSLGSQVVSRRGRVVECIELAYWEERDRRMPGAAAGARAV